MGDNKFIISNENNNNNVTSDNKSYKKTKSSINIIKVALYMLKKNKGTLSQPKKSKSSADLPNATNATISRLVGSVRPLHLQDGGIGGQSPPPPPTLPPFSPQLSLPGESSPELGETVAVTGMSPHVYEPSLLHSCKSSVLQDACSSSFGGMRRHYTSTPNLCDLDVHTSSSDAYYDGIVGDEMIDSKAEMFISKMYQQMRLQDIK